MNTPSSTRCNQDRTSRTVSPAFGTSEPHSVQKMTVSPRTAYRSTSRSIGRSLTGRPRQVVSSRQHFPVMRLELSRTSRVKTHRVPSDLPVKAEKVDERSSISWQPGFTAAPPGRKSCTDRTSQSEVFLKDRFYKGFVHLGVCGSALSGHLLNVHRALKTQLRRTSRSKEFEMTRSPRIFSTNHLWSPHFSQNFPVTVPALPSQLRRTSQSNFPHFPVAIPALPGSCLIRSKMFQVVQDEKDETGRSDATIWIISKSTKGCLHGAGKSCSALNLHAFYNTQCYNSSMKGQRSQGRTHSLALDAS